MILSCGSLLSSCGRIHVWMTLTWATHAMISKYSWGCAAWKPPYRDNTSGSHHNRFKTLSDKEEVWNSIQAQQKNSTAVISCPFCSWDPLNSQIYTLSHKHKNKFKVLQSLLGFSLGPMGVADRCPHGAMPNQHQSQRAKRRISSAMLTCGKPALQSSSFSSLSLACKWASKTLSDDKSVLQALSRRTWTRGHPPKEIHCFFLCFFSPSIDWKKEVNTFKINENWTANTKLKYCLRRIKIHQKNLIEQQFLLTIFPPGSSIQSTLNVDVLV